MIQFNKPVNLNGEELLSELQAAGIEINNIPSVEADGFLWLDIKESDKSLTETIVANHNGTTVSPEPTPADKLAAAGLTVNELKAVLGLN